MQENFTIIWSFRNRFDIFKSSIEKANLTTPNNVDFCLVDASSTDDTIKCLREFCNTIKNRTVRICESTYRSSLSEAWNLGMMLTNNRYVIFFSSDTIIIKDGWFQDISDSIISGSNEYVLMESHALFGFDKKAISKMGWFSEEFVIGPHFDVDFMIRASENNVNFCVIPNKGYYTHGDIGVAIRREGDISNRLPMHEITNENIFKEKWESNWPGWIPVGGDPNNLAHPPTHISQVKRKKLEIDPHPFYTKKMARDT
jgi:glycosyltransferase involved in cell wall biosynthesis